MPPDLLAPDLRWMPANAEKLRQTYLTMPDGHLSFVVGCDASLLKSLAEFLGLPGKKWQRKMLAK